MVGSVSTSDQGGLLNFAVVALLGILSSARELPPSDAAGAPPSPTILHTDPELAPRWQALESEELHARLWYWGWTGFFGAVVAGESVIALTTDNRGAKINAYYNIAFTGAGMLAVLLLPPVAVFSLDDIRAMPEDTEEHRAAKGRALHALFEKATKQEQFYRSPLNHVIGLTVNAGLAAVLYFGYKLGGRALLTLFAGSAIWEGQIWTHPTAARDLTDQLAAKPTVHIQWMFTGNGVAVAGTF